MKNNLKHRIIKAGMAFALFAGLLYGIAASAQPAIVLPTTGDNSLYSTAEPINTAMINYDAEPSKVVWGMVWQAGEPVYIKDEGTGLSATCTRHGGGTIADIAIGDASTAGNYVAAVAYSNYTGWVYVDFYDITGAGTTGLAIAYNSTDSISLTTTGVYAYTVHIDAICDTINMSTLPSCKRFILTWDDPNAPSPSVNATNGNFSAYTLNTTPAFPAFATGSQPDVAGVQKYVSGYTAAHDMGLVTYIDGSGNWVYQELDFTLSVANTDTVIASFSRHISYSIPRIDAIDNCITNRSSTIARWEAVAQQYDGTMYDVETSDNLLILSGTPFGSADAMDLSGCCGYTSPYNHYNPVVAISGPAVYSVFHWTVLPPAVNPVGATFLDPVDLTTGNSLSPNDYYWVNSSSGTTVSPQTGTISVCSSVNYNSNASGLNLYAWAEQTMPGNITKYKLSNASSFAFRQGTIPNSVTNPQQQQNWTLFPNPATNELNIETATTTNAATNYYIIDVTGCDLLQGAINGNSGKIDISQLAPGNYILKINDEDNVGKCMKFVKE